MRLIDADILEREGWYLSRNYVVDSKTRCFESKAIKKVPTAHPELNEWCHDCKEYDTEKGCCPRWGQVIRTALEEAKPEHKTGKWKKLSGSWFHDDVQCSECGNTLDMNGVNAGRGDANFCPNCGARMEI